MTKLPSICLVDDDQIFRFTFSRTLKSVQPEPQLLMFGDGAEAIDYIIKNRGLDNALPDILFLDINMPIMDGWQFLDEFSRIRHELCKDVQIRMLSSSVDPMDIEEANSRPEVSKYIVKPFTPDGMKGLFHGIA